MNSNELRPVQGHMLLIQGSPKGRNAAFDFSLLKRALTAHAVVVFSYCVRLTAPGCNFAFAAPTDVSSFLSTGKYSAKSHLSAEYDGAASEHLVVIFPAGDSNQLKLNGSVPAAPDRIGIRLRSLCVLWRSNRLKVNPTEFPADLLESFVLNAIVKDAVLSTVVGR